jgi:hypothetical protein
LAYESPPTGEDDPDKVKAREILQKQRPQMGALMDQLDINNPSVLPAILNEGPMMNAIPAEAECMRRGNPTEAHGIVSKALNAVRRIPGTKEWRERRHGSKPTYAIPCGKMFPKPEQQE